MSPVADPPRSVQQNFSAGMFRSVAPELIPPAGSWDIENGLLDEDGAIYKRGGSTYFSATPTTNPIQALWSGWLAGSEKLVFASTTHVGTIDLSSGAVTQVAATGLDEPGRIVAMDDTLYLPGGETFDGTAVSTAPLAAPFYAVVASRLLAGNGDRVSFSGIVATAGAAPVFGATDYHLLPGGVEILGLESLRDSAVVFTNVGIFVISNLGYDLTDADGNVQHRIDRYSADVVLWGDAGVAAWSGSLVVPALDAIWMMSLGVTSEALQAFRRISDPIEELYRAYVSAGYRPGQATVHRGHYILPILAGTDVEDVLVCRLDGEQPAWTHLSGSGAETVALTTLRGANSKLIGAVEDRALNLAYFVPTGATSADADGAVPVFSVTTRDIATGVLNENTILHLRARYQMSSADAAVLTAEFGSARSVGGAEWGLFDWGEDDWGVAGGSLTLLEGEAPLDPTGSTPFRWRVGKKTRFGRFRLRCTDAVTRLSLRSLEMFVRESGRL